MEEGLLDFAPGGNGPSKGLRAGCLACLWLLALCIHGPALANNGLNMIAFSAEGVGMGGADVPVAREALSLSVNPAGLSQLERRQFEVLKKKGAAWPPPPPVSAGARLQLLELPVEVPLADPEDLGGP